MSCGCTVGNAASYASCEGGAVIDQTPDAQLSTYAAQAGASSNNFTMCLAIAYLKTHRIFYFKNSPGDCGTTSSIQVSVGGQILKTAPGVAGAGLGIAGGLGTTSIAGVGLGVLGAATAGVGLLALPVLAITAHHAAAVANEQKTLCDVSVAFNQAIPAIESAVQTGNASVAQASQALDGIASQLDSVLATIAKPNTSPNAATGFRIGLKALVLYYKAIILPQLAPSNPVSGLLSGLFGSNVGTSTGQGGTGATSSNGKSLALLAGAGVVGAKVLGVI